MACDFWFGTEKYMQWVNTPLTGAEVSAQGWSAGGTMLNGGGYQANSFGSHRYYQFSWSNTSARTEAQRMKSYSDGTWGRGLIYFVDPLTYDTNILPASWADPSLTLGYEAPPLVYGITPGSVPTSNFRANGTPLNSATYPLGSVRAGYRKEDSVFIPIPDGYGLKLGAMYSSNGGGGVYATPINSSGNPMTPVRLTALAPDADVIIPDDMGGGINGVRLWVGTNPTVNYSQDFVPWDEGSWSGSGAVDTQVADRAWRFTGAGEVSAESPIPVSAGETLSISFSVSKTVASATARLELRSETGEVVASTAPVGSAGTWSAATVNFDVPFGVATVTPVLVGDGASVTLMRDVVVRRPALSSATVTMTAMIGRLYRIGRPTPADFERGPWIGGQGHSGCRFDGKPTYVNYTGVNGGQVGYGASFREVGSWESE